MADETKSIFNPTAHLGAVFTAWAKFFLEPAFDESKRASAWSDLRNPAGGGANCILDSEIMLCFLLPEARIPAFRFKNENPQGLKIEQHPLYRYLAASSQKTTTYSYWNDRIKSALWQYFERNSDKAGQPTFVSNSYLDHLGRAPTKQVVETVDAFSFSLTVSILVRLMADRLLAAFARDDSTEETYWKDLSAMASIRISASMEKLTQSFAVDHTKSDLWSDKTGRRWPDVEGDSAKRLRDLRDQLRGLEYRIPVNSAFEVGWSWGVTAGRQVEKKKPAAAAEAESSKAENAPYVYFTINALDGISDLGSKELEAGGVLAPEQLAPAAKLRALANLTWSYWFALGTADDSVNGPGEWEIETIPLKTADSQGSAYWNLYLARVALTSDALKDSDLERLAGLAERLAEYGRVTAPAFPTKDDPMVKGIHYPGLRIGLQCEGEKDNRFEWAAFDYAAQLLKMSAQIARMTEQSDVKQRMLELSQRVWSHLHRRSAKLNGLSWDHFPQAFEKYEFFGEGKEADEVISAKRKEVGLVGGQGVNSWYMTERVVEALVASVEAELHRPRPSDTLRQFAMSLFVEAHSLITGRSDQDYDDDSDRRQLEKCRVMMRDRPGEAAARLLSLLDKPSGQSQDH